MYIYISYNNLNIFVSSIRQHSEKASHQAFYIFNDGGGPMADLSKFIPTELDNVAYVVWPKRVSEKDTPLKTVLQLGCSLNPLPVRLFPLFPCLSSTTRHGISVAALGFSEFPVSQPQIPSFPKLNLPVYNNGVLLQSLFSHF